MAFFLNQRQKRAVTYAKEGRCRFAHAAMRDEVRLFHRRGSIPDTAFQRAAKVVAGKCGSILGSGAQMRGAHTTRSRRRSRHQRARRH